MKKIVFEFKDEYSHGRFIRRECTCESLDKCIEMYHLEECEYRIISEEEVENE